jgi:site-specific recombinase XerD
MNNLTDRISCNVGTIRHYVENALSQNTRRAYQSDLDHYWNWGGIVPSAPEPVAAYLSSHAEKLSIATMSRRLVAISKAHTMMGHPDPVKSDLVKLTFRGIRKIHGRPQAQVSPILKDDLVIMLSHIPDKVKGIRDRALLLLGFCGALRRSELVAIRIEDLEFTNQGIVLTLPRSKTDQMGSGRKIGIPHGRGRICPVELVASWIKLLSEENGFLFRSVTKGGVISEQPLSDRAVADVIKFYTKKSGLDPVRFSGHSLRAGAVSSAVQQGIATPSIRRLTGHTSDMMLQRYIRSSTIFSDAIALF